MHACVIVFELEICYIIALDVDKGLQLLKRIIFSFVYLVNLTSTYILYSMHRKSVVVL